MQVKSGGEGEVGVDETCEQDAQVSDAGPLWSDCRFVRRCICGEWASPESSR
jgi:hypothetical protein